ncbi:hypothetical protein BN59_03151 [Legionella massiliensis]|uniref:Uncharacterized protein n=1 Tax=Legionella massiliensis TaxID=1034943 RepID=A0A078L0R6_9GAMM|nr:hypothetical protein [Legionella massiliensis]CDZ78837.1 hypothetical protein BN59_03151 [Legionella massiliensis]CEE14575.1 hypothetical protein BN1094_03151 [Legionella massiliensis]
MAGENEEFEVDLESGLPVAKKTFWQANRRRFFYAGLILLLILVGAGVGAALVATGAIPILGAGALAIAAGAGIGALALITVVIVAAAIVYGAYQLFSFLFSSKPAELKSDEDEQLLQNEDNHDDDLSDDHEHDLGQNPNDALSVVVEQTVEDDEEHEAQLKSAKKPTVPSDKAKSKLELAKSDDEAENPLLSQPESPDRSSSSDIDFPVASRTPSLRLSNSSDSLEMTLATSSDGLSQSSDVEESSSSGPSSPRSSSSSEDERPSKATVTFLKRLQRTEGTRHLLVEKPVEIEARKALKNSFALFANEASSEQITRTVTGENAADFRRYRKEDLTKILSATTSQALLIQIEQRMQVLEQLKHPEPNWTYSRLDPQKPGEKVVIKIEYNDEAKPTSRIKTDKKRYSLATRKLSVIAGVLTLLDQGLVTDNQEDKQKIREYLTRLSNNIISDANTTKGLDDVNKSMDNFVKGLNKQVAKLAKTDVKNVVGPIREAERYFVAQHNQNKVLAVITHRKDGSKVVQVDNNFNHELTERQKQEYLRIHSTDNKPQWFTNLHRAEQAWYLARIPQTLGAPEWANFEKLFKSSAMQHTPGLANARVNYLIAESETGSLEIQSASMKSGTPVTYEMQQGDRELQTVLNTLQEIEKLEQLADHNFDKVWGDFFTDNELDRPQRLILIQSLLSNSVEVATIKVSKADEALIEAQRQAVNYVVDHGLVSSSSIVLHHNNATNSFRHGEGKEAGKQAERELAALRGIGMQFLARVVGHFTEGASVNVLDPLMKGSKAISDAQMEQITNYIDSLKLTEAQKLNLRILVNTENQFRKVAKTSTKTVGSDSRNQEEYIIALKKMFVEAMGGATKNNCKSGKDRTGQSEEYQHALCIVTHDLDGEVIAYDEKGATRKEFCETAALLNCTMKIQEAAAANTPGSVGTKAPKVADIIDGKILTAGNMTELFDLGCDLAGLNKCKVHQVDEQQKMNEIKRLDRKGGNRDRIEATSAVLVS